MNDLSSALPFQRSTDEVKQRLNSAPLSSAPNVATYPVYHGRVHVITGNPTPYAEDDALDDEEDSDIERSRSLEWNEIGGEI